MDEPFHARAIVSTSPARPMRSGAITSKAVPRRSPARPLVFYLYLGFSAAGAALSEARTNARLPRNSRGSESGMWRRQIP